MNWEPKMKLKPEIRALTSNPEEDESEGMKKSERKQKNEMGEKMRKQGNQSWIYTIRPSVKKYIFEVFFV